jgi:GNAT superfamily N-acetyltransferase
MGATSSRPGLRLVAMSAAEFDACLDRAIRRLAIDLERRGIEPAGRALAASRRDFAQLLPEGRKTPNRHFCTVVEGPRGRRVGETWYLAEDRGGRKRFWIDWIWIDPPYRRKGRATRLLGLLERLAADAGATRVGLSVVADNAAARALYAKAGYAPSRLHLEKHLRRTPRLSARRTALR